MEEQISEINLIEEFQKLKRAINYIESAKETALKSEVLLKEFNLRNLETSSIEANIIERLEHLEQRISIINGNRRTLDGVESKIEILQKEFKFHSKLKEDVLHLNDKLDKEIRNSYFTLVIAALALFISGFILLSKYF